MITDEIKKFKCDDVSAEEVEKVKEAMRNSHPTILNAEADVEQHVDHPAHYRVGKYECIDVMEEIFGHEAVEDFCLLNAFKYLWRCYRKADFREDIEKADWYIRKLMDLRGDKVTHHEG